ncbi:proline dehydrogenase family protein [Pseudogracilibacillus auburnensis]|uniref:proline dehydrogenase family protein n=1 Tax=Pseudogracilibacillus auburnensis TaxID=1494959 RepID=UPI001A959C73|nr:proline dehydrogenase [Pseudogracilibacillus auburnensis]MBO1005693.1 proline dehydrogenase [Pseudogracilibacillus auburnensis]
MEALTRNFFLFLSKSRFLNSMAQKRGSRLVTGKIIAGTDFQSSIPIIKQLNWNGLATTVDHLGEFVHSAKIASERTEEAIRTLNIIGKENLDSHLSVKLTSLGLDIDDDLVIENMTRILDTAEQQGIMVTIDMEDEPRCEKTLEIFKLFKQNYSCVSTVLQAYLYRSEQDLQELRPYQPFLRLVKGAYKEPPNVAYPNKKDVDDNYKKMIEQSLKEGLYIAVASHDDRMIEYTKELTKKLQIPKDQFEFQMLYGMRNKTQLQLVEQGYKVRVYVPYGRDWYGYFMRRLAERPANIAFAFKGILRD